jgi:DNA excision repair protein ERCC-5
MWMYQFVKAMSKEGDSPNPHLSGFFRRLCKLTYLQVRPIIVFDGPPPQLKIDTMKARADEQLKQLGRVKRAAEKLLLGHLEKRLKEGGGPTAPPLLPGPASPSSSDRSLSVYSLESSHSRDLSSRRRWGRHQAMLPSGYQGFLSERRNLDEIALPSEGSEMDYDDNDHDGEDGGTLKASAVGQGFTVGDINAPTLRELPPKIRLQVGSFIGI